MRIFNVLMILGFLAIWPLTAVAEGEKIAVIELFTTAGCTNCPPADAILKKVVDEYDGTAIALGCHVTYFDRKGWRDHLSLPLCDQRHRDYREAGVTWRLYTPQMVINGAHETTGSKEATVWSGLRMAESFSSVSSITLSVTNGYLNVTMPQTTLPGPVSVWLMGYDDLHRVYIGNGQNKDLIVDYVNAVRHIRKLMPWQGQKMQMAFPLESIPADSYVVIAQKADNTDIIAAGIVKTSDPQ